ncbi:MAG: NB-ARC domain-containing protein [Candidatus Eremiobacteraeota bacterium]|nr:NB-ARC domain-containing protein [Candidatus Eremiobacteraeota bacterium]
MKKGLSKPDSLPSGTVTFLFTDIEGSTQRWETHRAEMALAVARHEKLMRTAISKHGGFVFKTVGDAFCVAFPQAQDAVAAALNAQRDLASEDFTSDNDLRVRMAIHTGTAQERDADYFGPTVNRVARLLAIGHGGQVLVSGTATDLLQGSLPAQTSLRDLGEHQLRDLAFPEQVYQLVAPGVTDIFPPLRSLGVLPNNLPRQATVFVGRDQELADIKALLTKSQIVTIVGTGGVGKTRTALQVGADLLDGSGDGVWFVDLAQVASADYVVTAIAQVFNLQIQSDRDLLDDVRAHLKNKRLLLILDNCEHVVAEATRAVAAIVKDCRGVVVLATSREGLNVHGEQVYKMPSLAIPPAGSTPTAAEALTYGAIALFVARAAALDAQFSLSDDKAPIVADICRRLDGIALAIELAAARVTILNLKQLSQRLDERFRLLTGGDRTALPRQQTMRAAIDWSYDLLSEDERTIFRRLAIFQGGWTLEAASDICSDDLLDEFKIFDIISSLVNKSLVMVEFDAETQRYRFLESLRQYGIEHLRKQGEFDAVARRHARYFADYGRQVAAKWQLVPELSWLALIEAELDNVRAALQWCLDQGNDPMLGAELAERFWAYWFGRSLQEGRHWVEAARASVTPESNPALSVAIDLALSRILINFSWEEALAACHRALAGARALGDQRALSRALFYVGEAQLFAKQLDEAEAALTEARDMARRAGDQYREASARQLLGRLYIDRKQLDTAREHLTVSMRFYEKRGAERNRGIALVYQAVLERAAGDLPRAIELTREANRMAQTLGDRTLEMLAQSSTAACLVAAERFAEAKATTRAALLLAREEGLGAALASALQTCVALANHDRDFDRAARLFGYTEKIEADRTRLPGNAFFGFDPSWLLGPLRDHLSDERLRILMAEGATLSEAQGFEEALLVC